MLLVKHTAKLKWPMYSFSENNLISLAIVVHVFVVCLTRLYSQQ